MAYPRDAAPVEGLDCGVIGGVQWLGDRHLLCTGVTGEMRVIDLGKVTLRKRKPVPGCDSPNTPCWQTWEYVTGAGFQTAALPKNSRRNSDVIAAPDGSRFVFYSQNQDGGRYYLEGVASPTPEPNPLADPEGIFAHNRVVDWI